MSAPDGTDLAQGLSTVTRGTIFVIVSTLCLVLFNFLSRVLLVRSISPADWSAFSLGLALAAVLSAVGTLGLPTAVARSLPYAPTDEERRSIVRASVLASGTAAVVVAGLLWLVAGRIGQSLGNAEIAVGLEFFSIAIGASIVGTVLASVFQGFADVTPNALFLQIANPGLFLAFLGVALFLPRIGLTYGSALAAYALANAATLGGIGAYALRRLPHHLPAGPPAGAEATGRLFRFAAPLFVAGTMFSVAGFGDTLVLGLYHHTQVGTYTASLTLARLVQIGINAAAYIFLPVAAGFLRRENRAAIRLTYATVTKWMALLSLPLFLLFALLPNLSLGFVYGPNYQGVVEPLQLAVLGAFVATVFGPAATTVVAFGWGRLLAYNSVAAGLADLGLAFLLVPKYGYVGAAGAWASANILYTGLCLAELARLERVHPFQRHFALPLAATAVPLGAVFFLLRGHLREWTLPGIGLVAAGWFVVAVLATGSLDEGDRLLLGAVERILGRPLPFVRRLGRWYRRHHGPA